MDLQHGQTLDTRLDTPLDTPIDTQRGKSALALRLLASEAGQPPHAEDAFLADFVRFAAAHDAHAIPPWLAIEIGRAALDLVEDVDGPWQALPVAAWLAAAARVQPARSADELRLRARVFVEWLVTRGRLGLHGQRVLARRINALRHVCARAA